MRDIRFAAKETLAEGVIGDAEVEDEIRRADDSIARRNAHRTLPRLHLVDHEIASAGDLVVGQVIGDDVVILVRVGH